MSMSNCLRVFLVVALAATAACSKSSPAAPTNGPVTPPAIALSIDALETDAAVVGTSVTLHVQAIMPGASGPQSADGIVWTSSDERIARIDARGVMTPLAQGSVVISATSKGTTATRTIDVVRNMAGKWTYTVSGTNCSNGHFADGCRFDGPVRPSARLVPFPEPHQLVLKQTGTRLEGSISDWAYGFALTGRVDTAGQLDLEAESCHISDQNLATRFSLRNWRMKPAADGSYGGRLTLGQAGQWWLACGTETGVTQTDLIVGDFRQSAR